MQRASARRTFLREVFGAIGGASLAGSTIAAAAGTPDQRAEPVRHGSIRITKLETIQMADKIGHDCRNPQTYDEEDGSVVDW